MGVLHFLYFVLLGFGASDPLNITSASIGSLNNQHLICEEINHQNPFNGYGDTDICKEITTWTFVYGTFDDDIECQMYEFYSTKSLNISFEFLNTEPHKRSEFPVEITDDCRETCLYFSDHQNEFKVETSFFFLRKSQIFKLEIEFIHNTNKFSLYNKSVYILPYSRDINGLSNDLCSINELGREDEIDHLDEQTECYIKLASLDCTVDFLNVVGGNFFIEAGLKLIS